LHQFVKNWCKNIRALDASDDVSFNTWLEGTLYTRRKKKELEVLRQETYIKNVPFVSQYKYVKCFIKNESYSTYKVPRAILARADEFKIRVGPIFKAIENRLFSLEAPYGYPYFIKKVPIPDRPKVILDCLGVSLAYVDRPTEHLRRVMATDYSQFEASFQEDIMKNIELPFYEFMTCFLTEHEEFMNFVSDLMGVNTCIFKNWIFKILCRRMSGEMNTSLGNGFSNLMITLFTLSFHKCQRIRLFVEGDDCVCSYDGPIIDSKFLLNLGFLVKMKYLTSPSLASFCGQIFDLSSLVVITDPVKVILNFAWANMKYVNSAHFIKQGLIRSRAMSLLYQFPGCPIVQSVATTFIRVTRDYLPFLDTTEDRYHQEIIRDALRVSLVTKEVSMSSRELMFEVFGISVAHQLLIEEYFNSYIDGPINCPIVLNYCNDDMVHNYYNYVKQLL